MIFWLKPPYFKRGWTSITKRLTGGAELGTSSAGGHETTGCAPCGGISMNDSWNVEAILVGIFLGESFDLVDLLSLISVEVQIVELVLRTPFENLSFQKSRWRRRVQLYYRYQSYSHSFFL